MASIAVCLGRLIRLGPGLPNIRDSDVPQPAKALLDALKNMGVSGTLAEAYGCACPFLMRTGVRCSGMPRSLICTHPSLYETARNYIWWIAAIGLFIAAPLLVRMSHSSGVIRVVVYCALITGLVGLCLYLGLRKGSVVANLLIAKNLRTDHSKKIAELFFRGLPLLIAICGLVMLVSIAPPLFSYSVGGSSAVTESHTITHIDSAAMPGAFYIHMGITTDDGKHLSYWYPDQVLQTGNKYSFTILPNSDFVLEVQPVE